MSLLSWVRKGEYLLHLTGVLILGFYKFGFSFSSLCRNLVWCPEFVLNLLDVILYSKSLVYLMAIYVCIGDICVFHGTCT